MEARKERDKNTNNIVNIFFKVARQKRKKAVIVILESFEQKFQTVKHYRKGTIVNNEKNRNRKDNEQFHEDELLKIKNYCSRI